MNWQDHITATADTCSEKPRIKGTRITVELILDCLSSGMPEAAIVESYPHITVEQIRAAVAFAGSRVARETTLTGIEAFA